MLPAQPAQRDARPRLIARQWHFNDGPTVCAAQRFVEFAAIAGQEILPSVGLRERFEANRLGRVHHAVERFRVSRRRDLQRVEDRPAAVIADEDLIRVEGIDDDGVEVDVDPLAAGGPEGFPAVIGDRSRRRAPPGW